jgi:hypothetical protein
MSTDCSVCLAPFKHSADLACGHACCATCWDRWRNDCGWRGVRATCPVCRVPCGADAWLSSDEASESGDAWIHNWAAAFAPSFVPAEQVEDAASDEASDESSDWTQSPIIRGLSPDLSCTLATERLRVGWFEPHRPCLARHGEADWDDAPDFRAAPREWRHGAATRSWMRY